MSEFFILDTEDRKELENYFSNLPEKPNYFLEIKMKVFLTLSEDLEVIEAVEVSSRRLKPIQEWAKTFTINGQLTSALWTKLEGVDEFIEERWFPINSYELDRYLDYRIRVCQEKDFKLETRVND